MQEFIADHMFRHFNYRKPVGTIKAKAAEKVVELKAKVEERQRRIADIRADNGIDDKAMIELLQAVRSDIKQRVISYTSKMGDDYQERTITAGVAGSLFAEDDQITREKALIAKLEFIGRNLEEIPKYAENGTLLPAQGFPMDASDLEFLGF